jgi:hypothetical protein
MDAYEQGFIAKCAERGVDPKALIKFSEGDADTVNPRKIESPSYHAQLLDKQNPGATNKPPVKVTPPTTNKPPVKSTVLLKQGARGDQIAKAMHKMLSMTRKGGYSTLGETLLSGAKKGKFPKTVGGAAKKIRKTYPRGTATTTRVFPKGKPGHPGKLKVSPGTRHATGIREMLQVMEGKLT